MKSITTLENIPDSLDIQEMMDVKGGAEINANICLLAAAVKCTVAGAQFENLGELVKNTIFVA